MTCGSSLGMTSTAARIATVWPARFTPAISVTWNPASAASSNAHPRAALSPASRLRAWRARIGSDGIGWGLLGELDEQLGVHPADRGATRAAKLCLGAGGHRV